MIDDQYSATTFACFNCAHESSGTGANDNRIVTVFHECLPGVVFLIRMVSHIIVCFDVWQAVAVCLMLFNYGLVDPFLSLFLRTPWRCHGT